MEKFDNRGNPLLQKYYDSLNSKGKLKLERISRISEAEISFLNLNKNRSEAEIEEYLNTLKMGEALRKLGYEHVSKTSGFNQFMLEKKGLIKQNYFEENLSSEDFNSPELKKLLRYSKSSNKNK